MAEQALQLDWDTPAGREAAAYAMFAMACSSCMANFVRHMHPGYMMGWFHEEICDELDGFLTGVFRRESPRLLIAAPPRSGKSELASRMFPAYAFGKFPDIQLISTSYNANLASAMSRDVQKIMDSDAYRELYPETRLVPKGRRTDGDSEYLRQAGYFEIVGHEGIYRSAGIGGTITGAGADIIIIDDPLKNREEADSPTLRQNVWDAYVSTLYTRLSPGGGIILIQTRWHEDDLAGRILEAMKGGGEQWRCLSYPAIADCDEPHRKAGEALHPQRFSLKALEKIRQNIGSFEFAALYQQRPAPDEGAVFRRDWFRHWTHADLPADFRRIIMSWDMTFKDGAGNDFVVGQVWARKGANAYLLDQVRKRMGFVETCQAVKEMAGRWRPRGLQEILVEDTANGPAVIDSLKKLDDVDRLIPVKPDGSKRARAHAVTAFLEAGNVYFPADAPWTGELEHELLSFPSGAHDDQVDALTQALRRLMIRPEGAGIMSAGPRSSGGSGASWGFMF
ncbi:MAG: phage terminase large subunit [Deltaproteobacteria bacterium]|jgi:predicted phage terminase large subunit-like protein|nr:phage terminase large subunit [Deltaproteobacteria bacterium]